MMSEQGRILSALLKGCFVCQVSDEEGWRFLKNRENADKLEPHLNVLNRTLASTGEGEVFFAAYLTIGDEERKVLAQQFQETASALVPLVEWLLLVQQASESDLPVTLGNALRLNELQSVIEDTPAYAEQLEKISRYRLFNSSSMNLDGQLKQVFKRLTDLGYLIKPNNEKQIYLVTGKVEHLYEMIKFIDETESLSLSEQAEAAVQQGSLI
ncbi:condensin complex protein MksE [Alteromonas sp. 14N.309.X.WAT.G.H12]|uniref:condensin complex protein MksE n=1 Tax=Alteromonas sp. 14N.309.X.WAT.G.H12 TaxID=3120824 RepID=UPI002FD11B28